MEKSGSEVDFNYLFKLLLIGDSGVGKSKLLLSFTSDRFEDFSPSIGVDLKIKYVTLGGKKLKLAIWEKPGFVVGLVQGLVVPDAALLGTLFGSLTVGHVGLSLFDSSLLQRVEEEVHRRKSQYVDCSEEREKLVLKKPFGHEEFHARLSAVKLASSPLLIQESGGSG